MADRGKGGKGAPQGKKGGLAGGGGGGKKGGSGGGAGGADNDREDALQAVILADSFETRFSPFTAQRPRCLLPLANTPLIEYTLEFLAMSGVQDVYLYCGRHAAEVEQYLRDSKWHPQTSPASPFAILEMIKTTSRSVGDAMRDLDARALITGDFLLVHGDLVSNLPIDAALAAHKARRAADKNAIMTMILRSGGLDNHRTKAQGVTPIFVLEPSKQRCLYYEQMSVLQSDKYFNLEPELLADHSEMEIRTDLIDCGIDICTPDVLALWSESFDYDMPRKHFLHGVLKDYELNGKTIHTEIVTDHYAARVRNLQAYDAVSRDILGRWTYPLVPDSNLMGDHSYKFEGRSGICREDGVIFARSCKIGKKTVIGKDTSIGDDSIISNSILGRRCRIGKNVVIKDAYIWDDVVIEDGSQVNQAILAHDVVVGKNCNVSRGSLLSYGVRLADGTTVKEGERLTCIVLTEDRDDVEEASDEAEVVGTDGKGRVFYDSDEEDDEDIQLQASLVYSTAKFNISSESISTISSEISEPAGTVDRSRLDSFAGSITDDEQGSVTGETFHHDAVADVVRTLSENGDFHNLRVEFTSLRLSNNASDHQMRRAIAAAFVKRISQLLEAGAPAPKAVAEAIEFPGATSFINDVAIGSKRLLEDQVDFLLCVQKDLVHRNNGESIMIPLLKQFYDDDIVDEEAFEEWYEDSRSADGDELVTLRKKAEVFMTALRNAESDSEDESEEESEEDDDE